MLDDCYIKSLMSVVSRVITLKKEKVIIEEYQNPSWLKSQKKTEFPWTFPEYPRRASAVNHSDVLAKGRQKHCPKTMCKIESNLPKV